MSADKPSEQAMQMARDIGRLFFSDAFGPQPHPCDIRDAAFLIDQGIRNARAEAFEEAAKVCADKEAVYCVPPTSPSDGPRIWELRECASAFHELAAKERTQ